jgi:hypothetical protein
MEKKGDEKENFNRTSIKLIDKPIEAFLKMSPLEQAGTVIAVGLTSVLAVPRISPIRALFLGFRSLIRGPQTKSLRLNDVLETRKRVHNTLQKTKDQFLVIRGPKCIGKSVAIENALAHTWSVCYVQNSIEPGKDKSEIVEQVLGDFTNIRAGFIHKITWTEHLILWNNFFTFLSGRRRKPIIVITTEEREKGEPYAQIAETARDLAYMGIRVVIDSPDSALYNPPFTLREIFYEMEPMSLDLIEQMPEIKGLIAFLKKNNMFDELIEYTQTNFKSYSSQIPLI